MYRIKEECENLIEIEKSRFITYLFRVFSEEEAKANLLMIQKLHPNATHHCYAFIIGPHDEIQRSNDNGEPAGTAGVPMLESLKRHKMQDTLAITVRYFGGIKLGAGGLIRAYSHSVSEALKAAVLTQKVATTRYTLTFPYDFIGKLDYYFMQNSVNVLDKIYEENVTYIFRSTTDHTSALSEMTSGRYLPEKLTDEIVEEEIKWPF